MNRAVGGVQIALDLDGIAKMIGAGKALAEVDKDKDYMDNLVRAAFDAADEEFNLEAAAAGATGAIRHMFEWGTVGINRGRTNMRPNPLTERARLWNTTMNGVGLNQTIAYIFKPSLAYVPKPTKRDTGMATEVIESLERHVFNWKAMVLETGATVTIKPVNARMLLIPWYPEGAEMFTNYDKSRGFKLSKGPHTHSPGDTGGTTGTFTAFWTEFWNGRGNDLMSLSLKSSIEKDFLPEMTVPQTGGVKKARKGGFTAQTERRKKETQKRVSAKAAARRRGMNNG